MSAGTSLARATVFDVICAGDSAWNIDDIAARENRVRVRPGASAVKVAGSLARRGLRVGLATVLADDRWSRELVHRLAEAGVDVSAVSITATPPTLVLVRGVASGEIVPVRPSDAQPAFSIPAHWSSQVLLLSGLTPLVPHAAALCRSARAAHRAGALVVIDVDARWHLWSRQDPRAIRSVLREADVVACTYDDLVALGADVSTLRQSLREGAVLVLSDRTGLVRAHGPFGELVVPPAPDESSDSLEPRAKARSPVAGVCLALARSGDVRADSPAFWDAALRGNYLRNT